MSEAQVYDIFEFDETSEGAWSDIANTTLVVPRVADGSITLDGAPSSAEYGGFAGQTILPGAEDGNVGNAWILNYALNKDWEGADDSSFTFWLAHDTDYLYVGVDVKDDVVNSNDPNPSFWKDDAIEIIVDANNDRVNFNTDEAAHDLNAYGGHSYLNYEGRFSRWDEDLEEPLLGWADDVDWIYGSDGQVYGVGEETATGWSMEARFHKSQFEDPNSGNKLENGYKMGFNIGMDDDDGSDLEIQYWWANRARPLEFDYNAYLDGETINDYPPEKYDWLVDANGRLTHAATGEIIFGDFAGPTGDFNNDGTLDTADIDALTTESAAGTNSAAYDLTGDQIVDVSDVQMWVKELSNSWIGDANLDGEFNSADLVNVLAAGTYEADVAAVWSTGDFNGDGHADSSDLVAGLTDGGYELGPRAAVRAVPEPTVVVLFGLGLCTLFVAGRRERRF